MKDDKFQEKISDIKNNTVEQLILTYTAPTTIKTDSNFLKDHVSFAAYKDADSDLLNMQQIMDLARALAENTSVTYLDLSGQPMKDYHFANALAEMLAANKELNTVKLNNCKMGAVGLTVFAAGVARNNSVERLELRNNMPDGEENFESALYSWNKNSGYTTDMFINNLQLEHNQVLSHLDLTGNKLDGMNDTIHEKLNKNPESAITLLLLSDETIRRDKSNKSATLQLKL